MIARDETRTHPAWVDLADALLQAIEEPGLWPVALSRLAELGDFDQVMLLRAEGGKRAVLATNRLDPQAIRRLAGRRSDLDETLPVCPPRHREVALPGEGRLSLLVDRDQLPAETAAWLEQLAPLSARAWRLTDLLAANERSQTWSAAVLDRLASGVLVLAADATVLQANAAARSRLAEQDALRIEGGRLSASSPALTRTIGALVATDFRQDERRVAAETLHVPRSGARSLEVLLVASPRFADAEPRATTVALLFDPSDAAENPATILASRFGLSFEETQVIGQLLHGRSIPEIAATLGVPREVIAACLRGLYEQVGTTRQVELVKVLLAHGR